MLSLAGWRIEGGLPDEPRFVVIVAPHTSNWDFVLAILLMFAVGVRLTWLGKHSIFRFPVRGLLRWLGGEPIDRTVHQGTVEAAIARFRERPQWVLGIAPEGTRKAARGWKLGFYRIALGAGVPIVPVWLDFRQRLLGFGAPFRPAGDLAADLAAIGSCFRADMARYPEGYTVPLASLPELEGTRGPGQNDRGGVRPPAAG